MINEFITERWDVTMICSQAPWGVQSGLVVVLAGVGNDDYPLWFGDCEKPLLVSKISVRCTISYLQCAFIWIFWVLIWKLNGCVLIILSYFASQLFHGVHWAQEVMFYFDYPSQSKELVWGRKAVSLGLWSCDWGLEWGGCGSPCCWWPLPGERPLTEAAHSSWGDVLHALDHRHQLSLKPSPLTKLQPHFLLANGNFNKNINVAF